MDLADLLRAVSPAAAGLAAMGFILWHSRKAREGAGNEMRFPAAFIWVLGACGLVLLAIAGAGLVLTNDGAMAALFALGGILAFLGMWGFMQVRHSIEADAFTYRAAFRSPRTIPWQKITQFDFVKGRNAWALSEGDQRILVGGMLTGQGGLAQAAVAHLDANAITPAARTQIETLFPAHA